MTKARNTDKLIATIARLRKALSQKHCPHCSKPFKIKKPGNPHRMKAGEVTKSLKGDGNRIFKEIGAQKLTDRWSYMRKMRRLKDEIE